MIVRMFAVIGALLSVAVAMGQDATMILSGGTIWTGDSARPYVDAVAVGEGKILAVGTVEDLTAYRGSATRMVDLQGQFLMPGLIDDHAHFVAGGFQLQNVDLRDAATAGRVRTAHWRTGAAGSRALDYRRRLGP